MRQSKERQASSMKTIAEIAQERGVHRTTLNKAIDNHLLHEGISVRKSGSIWLIDEESDEFKTWLAGSNMGRPRTIKAETPDAPEWVNTQAAKYAWKNNHEWRVDAARADKDEAGAQQYRQFLLREAERMYSDTGRQ
jgi:hypothetical protein